ncbi:MAG: hypothetical protein HZA30_04460 [Candidatus Omnitrophica bacterium]|nr:hypothetical protein [Candidatus Omnitrophota bacterium]
MRVKNRLIAILIFTIVIVAAVFYSDHIVIYAISKMHHLEISYSNLENRAFRELVLTDLGLIDAKRGVGLVSKYAIFKPKWERILAREMESDFHLSGVRFVRNEPEGPGSYDTLSDLVYTPFASRWTYKDISGKITVFKRGVHIKDVVATSDDIRTSLAGDIYYDNSLNLDIMIYFSNRFVTKIPDVLSTVVLKEEEGEWKSLSVNLKGNYKTPSIEVSGALFRLNIGELSTAK